MSMVESAARLSDVEAAISRVLGAERDAREAVARAMREAEALNEGARAAARALAERTERRAVLEAAAPLAAAAGNLERLLFEYRRAVRRVRALQDVLLPELDRDVADIESRLEELEQEDSIGMRHGARHGVKTANRDP